MFNQYGNDFLGMGGSLGQLGQMPNYYAEYIMAQQRAREVTSAIASQATATPPPKPKESVNRKLLLLTEEI